jgi:hypothetical protein
LQPIHRSRKPPAARPPNSAPTPNASPSCKLGTDAECVAFLFERYQALTSLLRPEKPKRGRRKPASEAE